MQASKQLLHGCPLMIALKTLIPAHPTHRSQVNDSQALRAAKISPRAVGRSVDEAFAEMTFVHGYIHADPHPGNIMVRPKGGQAAAEGSQKGVSEGLR